MKMKYQLEWQDHPVIVPFYRKFSIQVIYYNCKHLVNAAYKLGT